MRYTQLVFSPTGGVRKAAGLLSAAISDRFETIDLSLAERRLFVDKEITGEPDYRPDIYKKFL